ncbi:hypothetical protein KC19_4G261700 [Ceratodon purpureus]|uniref:Uncharacterized protein n=2 Tax=Ceratodon purpureus TaxID=3225 RepID=A0A8T0IEX5_CERPU|nr:hypothetical protein KC19_4G261700 [Ceratodon purpureus]
MLGFQSTTSNIIEGFGENTKGMLQLVPFLFDQKEQSFGSRTDDEMTLTRLSVKASPNCTNFLVDTGNPLLNCTLDGVLKIGGVGAAHAATQETYSWMRKGIICTAGTEAHNNKSSSQIFSSPDEQQPTTRRDIEKIVKKAGKEGLQWGMVAGMYAGFEYGIGKARKGKHDWRNAAVGGALTGAILSVSDGRLSQDKLVRTAITASALATAAEFLKIF